MDSPASWPKACGCGEIWSRDHWPELPLVGRYLAGSEGWVELRTCVCGRTIAVQEAELEGDLNAPTASQPRAAVATPPTPSRAPS